MRIDRKKKHHDLGRSQHEAIGQIAPFQNFDAHIWAPIWDSMENILFLSVWESFEVGHPILSRMTWAVASMGQGGKFPLPQISVLPQIGSAPITIVAWLKQLPLKITIMPISLTNHIMHIS